MVAGCRQRNAALSFMTKMFQEHPETLDQALAFNDHQSAFRARL
jgi:hypothetical protein